MLVFLAAVIVGTLAPAGASALYTRVPTSFSPIDGSGTGAAFTQSPTDIAVDEATGNVFVLIGEEVRIFNAEGGVPVGIAPPYSITGVTGANSIEVDNGPSSPKKGAVYVAAPSQVTRFVRNAGTEAFEAAGELVGSPSLAGVTDIALDAHGNVVVGISPTSFGAIAKFAADGTQLSRINLSTFPNSFRPTDLAVTPAGDVFVTQLDYSSGNPPSSNTVWKYPANSSGEIEEGGRTEVTPRLPLLESYYGSIAVDVNTNHLYVAEASRRVSKYDASSLVASTSTFGPDFLTLRRRFSINASTDRVYNADQNKLVVFGPEIPLPTIQVNETSQTGTKATLNAAINPLGTTVEECTFEHGTTVSYGTTKSCDGAIPPDSNFHSASASLSGLTPQGQTYHFRVKVKNSNGTAISEDRTFTTPDIYATGDVSPVASSTATLHGTIRPEGAPLTECKFEYGTLTVGEASKPCSPGFESIAGDFTDHAVSAALVNLKDQATYMYRISAASSLGSFKGEVKTFVTGGPMIAGQSAIPGRNGATITTYINPRGFNTSYYYEYGTDASYGSRIPTDVDVFVGSGTTLVKGSGQLSGLAESTTYHYRVVAASAAGTTIGPDQQFTTTRSNASCPNASVRVGQTSAAYPEGTVGMPACMALEMVSPPKKFNQYARDAVLSATGNAVSFRSIAALADTPKLGSIFDNYVAARGDSSWSTHATQLSPDLWRTNAIPCAYSTDLSRWTGWGASPGGAAAGQLRVFSAGIGRPVTPLTPLLSPVSGASGLPQATTCSGGSVDSSRIFFRPDGDASYLPNDPVLDPNIALRRRNVYEAYLDGGTPSIALLQRDKSGVVYGGSCGSVVGGGEGRRRGSVSSDASRVYFTAHPSQPEGSPCDTSTYKARILLRLQTPDGPEISEPIAVECTRVSPPCDATNGSDEYLGASQEGTKVIFATTRQLANSDLDTTTDLYLYDSTRPAGAQLTQITSGDASNPSQGKDAGYEELLDFSGDGTRVYFLAKGLLTTSPNALGKTAEDGNNNLYLYQKDEEYPSGRTVFVGTVGSGPITGIAVPALGGDVEDVTLGGDGHILVFETKAELTPDDTDGTWDDTYRYDARSGSLERITRAAVGGADNGQFSASSGLGSFPQSQVGGQVEQVFGRPVSEDGRTILFRTEEALDPNDVDDESTPYIWHGGSVAAVPGSIGTRAGSSWSLSMIGNTAVFISASRLLPADGDAVEDVYVLRANGGFAPPAPPTPCQGEGCQEPFRAQPGAMSAASESFSAPGNAKFDSRPTKPKKRHKERKRKAKPSKSKRAGHKRGGQK